MEDELMTRQEVADYLKVSLKTADAYLHSKNFHGLVHIGRSVRISKRYLPSYIEEHRE